VDVLLDKGQLQIQIDGKRHPLFANTQLQFYQEGEFLNASFDSAVRPEKMIIEKFFGVIDLSLTGKRCHLEPVDEMLFITHNWHSQCL